MYAANFERSVIFRISALISRQFAGRCDVVDGVYCATLEADIDTSSKCSESGSVFISKNELSNYAITGAEFLRRLLIQMCSDSDYDYDIAGEEEEDGPYELILYVDGCDSDDSYYDSDDSSVSHDFVDSSDSYDFSDFADLDDSDDEAILTI
jgi:hypothetical protein